MWVDPVKAPSRSKNPGPPGVSAGGGGAIDAAKAFPPPPAPLAATRLSWLVAGPAAGVSTAGANVVWGRWDWSDISPSIRPRQGSCVVWPSVRQNDLYQRPFAHRGDHPRWSLAALRPPGRASSGKIEEDWVSARYCMIAVDSQSVKSPSWITGMRPFGFKARKAGECCWSVIKSQRKLDDDGTASAHPDGLRVG